VGEGDKAGLIMGNVPVGLPWTRYLINIHEKTV
jgi:hypothetical protein